MPKPLNYRPPCNAGGSFLPWLLELRNQSGAYVIRSGRSGRVLYVGESHTGRLANTVKRHFWPWRDSADRPHHAYRRGDVEIAVRITPPSAAVATQNKLIRRLDPRDNLQLPAEEDPF